MYSDLFEQFSDAGKLLLPEAAAAFQEIPWQPHPVFEGVELKHIVSGAQTGGQFSFHLVRIAPNHKIGVHIHEEQLETHEVIAGNGVCINGAARLDYSPGVISIFPKRLPHEVSAGPDGLFLFAKFIPALS